VKEVKGEERTSLYFFICLFVVEKRVDCSSDNGWGGCIHLQHKASMKHSLRWVESSRVDNHATRCAGGRDGGILPDDHGV